MVQGLSDAVVQVKQVVAQHYHSFHVSFFCAHGLTVVELLLLWLPVGLGLLLLTVSA